MTAHDPISLRVEAGNDVGGYDISGELRQKLWPGVTDAQFVAAFKGWIRERMKPFIVNALGGDLDEQAKQYILDNVTDVD